MAFRAHIPTSTSLVLFDIDGTLIRGAGPHHKQALIEGIRRVTGRDTTLEGIGTAGMLDGDLITAMLQATGETQRRIRTVLGAAMRASEESYLAGCAIDLSGFLCPGAGSILEKLSGRGVALAVVSGNLPAIGWRKLELAGIRAYFSTGAFAGDGRTRVRLAQVAAQRARRAGLIAKGSRISLVGDHANDVAAAKANGFQSVAVATGVLSFAELTHSQPDILVERLEELDLEKLV